MHESVARAIEKLYPEKLDERAALVAHHWEAAGKPLEAARWNARAAGWAGTNAAAEAFRHWKKVRELLDKVPESEETVGLGFAARGQILGFGWRMGLPTEESERVFEEGRVLAERSGSKRALASLYWAMGGVIGLQGNMGRYMELNAEGLRHAEASGDMGARYAIRTGCSWAHYHAGLLREAFTLNTAVLDHTPSDLRTGAEITGYAPYVFIRGFQGLFTGYVSSLDRGAEILAEYRELASRGRPDIELLCLGHAWTGDFADLAGDVEAAYAHARQAFELGERSGSEPFRTNASATLVRAHLSRREWSEAAARAREGLAFMREQRSGLEAEARLQAGLAEALLGSGDVEAAFETANDAIATAERSGSCFWEIPARLAAARVVLASASKPDVVASHLERALRLIERAGARALVPFARVEKANLAGALGDDAAVARELSEARTLFLAVGAPLRAATIAERLASIG